MQMSVAEQLRKSVTRCPEDKHQWEKEYYNGANTGDYVCSICGAEISGHSYEQLRKNKLRGE